jgi:hypothetical protein
MRGCCEVDGFNACDINYFDGEAMEKIFCFIGDHTIKRLMQDKPPVFFRVHLGNNEELILQSENVNRIYFKTKYEF